MMRKNKPNDYRSLVRGILLGQPFAFEVPYIPDECGVRMMRYFNDHSLSRGRVLLVGSDRISFKIEGYGTVDERLPTVRMVGIFRQMGDFTHVTGRTYLTWNSPLRFSGYIAMFVAFLIVVFIVFWAAYGSVWAVLFLVAGVLGLLMLPALMYDDATQSMATHLVEELRTILDSPDGRMPNPVLLDQDDFSEFELNSVPRADEANAALHKDRRRQ